MEDNDYNNSRAQFNNNDNENRIVSGTNISRKRKKLFWLYDIRNFPDSLLTEILARLPVKSIFLFKSVCKHWQTLISHPSFSLFYHSILNSNSDAATLPFRILNRYSYVPNFNEFVNRLAPEVHSWSEFSVLFLSTPEEQFRYGQLKVLDMSNGLILCCWQFSTPMVYYICDPLTRLWITIPRRGPQILHGDFNAGLITSVNEDHMLTRYLVVRVEHLEYQSDYLNLEMFSSETGEWINYKVPCAIPIQLREMTGGPIYCYGALHWPVSHHKYGIINGMLAFDPNKDPKSIRLIPLPDNRVLKRELDYLGVHQLCGESQGTLRYFEVVDRNPTKFNFLIMNMWAMEDYEKGEWCCVFKVRHSDIYSSNQKLSKCLLHGWFLPLSFHPSNPNVVYLKCMEPECVVSCDVMNRRLDVACKQIGEFISSGSVIRFVLPRWPVLVSTAATVKSKIKGVKCRK